MCYGLVDTLIIRRLYSISSWAVYATRENRGRRAISGYNRHLQVLPTSAPTRILMHVFMCTTQQYRRRQRKAVAAPCSVSTNYSYSVTMSQVIYGELLSSGARLIGKDELRDGKLASDMRCHFGFIWTISWPLEQTYEK